MPFVGFPLSLSFSFALFLSLFLSVSLTHAITQARAQIRAHPHISRSLPPLNRPTSYISNPSLSHSRPLLRFCPIIISSFLYTVLLLSPFSLDFRLPCSHPLAKSVGENRPRDGERERAGLNYLPPAEKRSLPTTIITTTITRPVFTPISRQHHRASSRFTRGPSLYI